MPKLTIDVEGQIATYLDAINKADVRTKRFVRDLESSFRSSMAVAAKAFAAAFSAHAIAGAFKDGVAEMSSLADAAQKTGASVEELSSVLDTLRPYGTTLSDITGIATRLAQSMQEASKGSGRAAEAFAALGIATQDTRGNLRPVMEVLDDVSRKLAGYADGTNKVALAQALLGRRGADTLPVLRNLADAHRQAASVTTEQAAAAERFNQRLGELNREFSVFRNGIVSDILPALSDFIVQLNEGREAAGGFWAAVWQFGTDSTNIASNVEKYSKRIDELRERLERLDEMGRRGGLSDFQSRGLAEARARLEKDLAQATRALEYYRRRQIDQKAKGAWDDLAFDYPDRKPEAPPAAGSQTTERISEGQRYIDTLRRQVALVGDLTEAERLRNLQAAGLLKFDSAAQRQRAEALAAEIDGAKRRETIAADQLELASLIATAEQRNADQIRETVARYEDLADPVRVYRREIERINELVAEHGLSAEAAAAAAAQAWDRTIGATRSVASSIEDAKSAASDFGYAFQSAFESAAIEGRKLSDVINGLIKDLARAGLRQLITEPLLKGATSWLAGSLQTAGGSGVDLSLPQLDLPTGKSLGGLTLSVVNHIDSRTDQAAVARAVEQGVNQSVARVVDMRRRGSLALD